MRTETQVKLRIALSELCNAKDTIATACKELPSFERGDLELDGVDQAHYAHFHAKTAISYLQEALRLDAEVRAPVSKV
jgi:hypothetical protein